MGVNTTWAIDSSEFSRSELFRAMGEKGGYPDAASAVDSIPPELLASLTLARRHRTTVRRTARAAVSHRSEKAHLELV